MTSVCAVLCSGTAFDAQKQFLANVQDAISSPVDLPSGISHNQDVLQYARFDVNFSFGTRLYMAPSGMLLRIGHVEGYKNNIVITTAARSHGHDKAVEQLQDAQVEWSLRGLAC